MTSFSQCSDSDNMHARDLVEMAVLVAENGPAIIAGTERLPATGIERYWSATSCRFDRWGRELKQLTLATTRAEQEPGTKTSDPRDDHDFRESKTQQQARSLVEEILVSEALTRVWAATMSALDHRRNTDDAGPIARRVMLGHMELRIRALSLIAEGKTLSDRDAVAVNQLRRRIERWGDVLNGQLHEASHFVPEMDLSQFAFNPNRARDFAEDIGGQSRTPGQRNAWTLAIASLRSAFSYGLCPRSPNTDLNFKIAASILSCIDSDLFEATGPLREMWQIRLSNNSSEAQDLVDAYFDDRAILGSTAATAVSSPSRHRNV